MNNELNLHKKSDKVKWIITFVLIAVLLVGMIGMSVKLFSSKESSTPLANEPLVADTSGVELTCKESNGISLFAASYDIEPSREDTEETGDENEPTETTTSSYILTATVKPDNVRNKALDWDVYFKNPSSTWATGKTVTDYVTVEPYNNMENQVLVTCHLPFGEEIEIKATAQVDSTKTATCAVNYLQRVENMTAQVDDVFYYVTDGYFNYTNGKRLNELRVMPVQTSKKAVVDVAFTKSEVYTKAMEGTNVNISITPTEAFVEKGIAKGYSERSFLSYNYNVPESGKGEIVNFFDMLWLNVLMGGDNSAKDEAIDFIVGYIAPAYTITFSVNGKEINSFSMVFDIAEIYDSVAIEDISFDQTELDF